MHGLQKRIFLLISHSPKDGVTQWQLRIIAVATDTGQQYYKGSRTILGLR